VPQQRVSRATRFPRNDSAQRALRVAICSLTASSAIFAGHMFEANSARPRWELPIAGYCPKLKRGWISEVGTSAPTKSVDEEGVLTPAASWAEARRHKA
jgi:hypothetical protein